MRLTKPVDGKWLQGLRKAAGLQQQEVAEYLDILPSTLCEAENGKRGLVAPELAARIMEAVLTMHSWNSAHLREMKRIGPYK